MSFSEKENISAPGAVFFKNIANGLLPAAEPAKDFNNINPFE